MNCDTPPHVVHRVLLLRDWSRLQPIGAELLTVLRQVGAGAPTNLASAALWLGSVGSVTPLHFDTSHNVYIQLHGAKRVQLLPPSAAASAHLYPSLHPGYRQSLLDISHPALNGSGGTSNGNEGGDRYEAAAEKLAASALEVVLHPGDVLILPPFWLHSIEAIADEDEDGEGGVASLACWFTAAAYKGSEEIYAERLPFKSTWDSKQRATAVFAFLRMVGRAAGGNGTAALQVALIYIEK